MKITLPDASTREYQRPLTVADIAADIGPGLAKATLGGDVNGTLVDAGLSRLKIRRDWKFCAIPARIFLPRQ
mgnify:CR=1 FL=1